MHMIHTRLPARAVPQLAAGTGPIGYGLGPWAGRGFAACGAGARPDAQPGAATNGGCRTSEAGPAVRHGRQRQLSYLGAVRKRRTGVLGRRSAR